MGYVKDYSYNTTNNTESADAVVARAYRDMFGWMACGLCLSALTAFVITDLNLVPLLVTSKLMWVLMFASLGLVLLLSGAIHKLSFVTATLCFAAYSIIMGAWITPVVACYTYASVFQVFSATAASFITMAVYGHLTKRDLSSVGKICFMALIGIIVASIINIFVASYWTDFVISIVGVLLFCGLTMYDVQRFKRLIYLSCINDQESVRKIALLGALELYLDFVNLFLYLLRLLGNRR